MTLLLKTNQKSCNRDIPVQPFFKSCGFELLTESALLNAFTFTEKKALADELDLFGSPNQCPDAALKATLSQSPFNDLELLDLWFQHHQLDKQRLTLLHDNQWLKQTAAYRAALKDTQADDIPQSPLLTDLQLGKLALFRAQINEALLGAHNAQVQAQLVRAFLPALLNRLYVISHQAIHFTGQKYGAKNQNDNELRYRIFNHFPALLRQITRATSDWLNFLCEFSTHLNNDLELLQKTFGGNKPLGSLQAILGQPGDRHNHGRFAFVCEFSSGKKLVYKPRSLALDQQFYQLLAVVNDCFYQPAFVLRQHYGWMEYIEALSCEDSSEVEQYYYHSGYLLSVLYLLEAEDIHHQNVIARGNCPVIVDLETLFHQRDDSVTSDKVITVHHSVLKTHFIGQYDSATPEQDEAAIIAVADSTIALNRSSLPTFNAQSLPLNDYNDDFIQGFRTGYHRLLALKGQLPQLLNAFKGLTARYIARPTQIYNKLWSASCQPYYQQSGLMLEMSYEKLWVDVKNRPFLSALIDAEKASLLQGDIPLFNTIIGEKGLFISEKTQFQHYFKQDGLSLVMNKLARMSLSDCEAQVKIIEHSVKLNQKKTSLIQHEIPENLGEKNDYWLDVSEIIGRQIIAQIAVSERSVFWPVHKRGGALFCLDGTNYHLHDGVPGILFYLAYLNDVRPHSVDQNLLKRAVREVLTAALNQPFRPGNCGAFEGLGGLVYLISHLFCLWHESWLIDFGQTFIDKLAIMVASDSIFDVMAGSAGAVLSLLSYYQATEDKQALLVAESCGEHLVEHFSNEQGGWANSNVKGRVLNGFSHGNAGIAYALMSLYQYKPKDSYKQVAIKAIEHEQTSYCDDIGNWLDYRFDSEDEQRKQAMTAWCNGSMGIGYSRHMLLGQSIDEHLTQDISRATANVLAKPQLKDHGLCHGHFGNMEFIQSLATLDKAQFGRRINDYLQDINNQGLLAGRDGIEQLGLMDGLSGIGYQLLKLSQPQRLPSLLMLQAPQPT